MIVARITLATLFNMQDTGEMLVNRNLFEEIVKSNQQALEDLVLSHSDDELECMFDTIDLDTTEVDVDRAYV